MLTPSSSSNGEIEKALIRKWNIDGVVCRQSGGAIENLWQTVCTSMGIDLFLLQRPAKHKCANSIDNYEKLIKENLEDF